MADKALNRIKNDMSRGYQFSETSSASDSTANTILFNYRILRGLEVEKPYKKAFALAERQGLIQRAPLVAQVSPKSEFRIWSSIKYALNSAAAILA